jgi:hypothetical protein
MHSLLDRSRSPENHPSCRSVVGIEKSPQPGGTAAMAHLAAEFDQKLLGNGHRNRPTQLDCQFESICESCAYFSTNSAFVPVLEAQRDQAASRDQHHRVDLFDMLIERVRTEQQ